MSYTVDTPGADTLVVVSTARKYKMHSALLIQSSAFFADLFRDPGPLLTREGLKTGMRYVVCLQTVDQANKPAAAPVFKRIQVNNQGRIVKAFSQIQEGDRGANMRKGLLSDYDKLLRIFANENVVLNDETVDTLLPECMGLIEVAEHLGSIPMVAKIIEVHLLAKGQEFFRAISVSPVVWIDVAYRIQSKMMFKEALIHLTGQYNALKVTEPDASFVSKHPRARCMLDKLRPEIRELLERKHEELTNTCRQVDMAISSHYPNGIQKTSVTGRADRDGTTRQAYSRDIFTWIAVGLYRHWWGQMMASDRNHNNRFGGQDMYSKLAMGGKEYLTRDITVGFNEHFPMSGKGLSVLENNLDIIKEGVKGIVQPLMKNESQIDVVSAPVKWLTCTKVLPKDYIWEPEPEPEKTYEGKGKRRAEEAFEEEEDEEDGEADADAEADDEEDM